ncbi:hypothetical protein IRZ59_13480 [Pseudomonas guariconensis]|uniref:hypothetical protein n=1 Tax=Pseudomonas guariconensis TaxID=1288410 RepID=UPI0018A940A2|nr:hypothetical protein [Pseudomonas guariconensis]MBF8731444.1 hypothetical protein [Pseudomonas guariconensis]
MSIFSSKAAYKQTMPSVSNFEMRGVLPGPRYSMNPATESKLGEWANLSAKGLCLVHAIRTDHGLSSELTRRPAEEVFQRWDVFSTSLIVCPSGKAGNQRTPLGTFAAIGLILEVPPENILGTFRGDVYFPTHETGEKNKFARSVLSGRSAYKDKPLGRRVYIKGGYNRIETPEWVASKIYIYSEVLVVGRPGFKLHYAMTKPIKVVGILHYQNCELSLRDLPWERAALLRRLCELNPKLPLSVV